MEALLLVLVAFVAMEPVTYVAHRWVMHGVGYVLHRSHHHRARGAVEANDLFPVGFAALTILAIAAGVTFPQWHRLAWVGAGVTLYGAAYTFVHDVYIHDRFGRLPRVRVLERLREAHRVHHLFGGEPYGMLFPVVPKALRERAARTPGDPLPRHRGG